MFNLILFKSDLIVLWFKILSDNIGWNKVLSFVIGLFWLYLIVIYLLFV